MYCTYRRQTGFFPCRWLADGGINRERTECLEFGVAWYMYRMMVNKHCRYSGHAYLLVSLLIIVLQCWFAYDLFWPFSASHHSPKKLKLKTPQ